MLINRTEFKIPKMDCPAEEQMIRTALDDVESIRLLEFNIADRGLVVWHSGDTETITNRLIGLNLGTTFLKTTEESESHLPSKESGVSDRDQARVLWILLGINALMFVVEFVSGWLFESTGLLADSLDMFADAAVYGIGLYAVGKASQYKLRAAHISGWFQFTLAIGALFEVVRRFIFGSEPDPPYMIAVAIIALIANVSCLWLIARHRDQGAHMKASWIFSTNDVIANLGVIVAGILVGYTGSRYPDLLIGTIIGIVVFIGSIRILKLR
jgi:Co/Zn/Cd efflux system component